MTTQKNKPDKNELIKNAVEKLSQMFESGKFPEAAAMSVIRKREEISSDKWSLYCQTWKNSGRSFECI